MLDDIKKSVQEREKGIAGVDARELLAEMKRIVDEAGEKESKGNKSDD
ncbi:MAG: hypothetical protein IK128_07025 [Clostridiales bacterium]|nr:hypothetical protein [Clostridiales bacterium]